MVESHYCASGQVGRGVGVVESHHCASRQEVWVHVGAEMVWVGVGFVWLCSQYLP